MHGVVEDWEEIEEGEEVVTDKEMRELSKGKLITPEELWKIQESERKAAEWNQKARERQNHKRKH